MPGTTRLPPLAPRPVSPRGRRLFWAVAVLGTVAAWIPLLSVALCSALAGALSCRVDESTAHPCMFAGVDIGPLLYTLGMMGWLMLATAPFMLATLVFWPAAALRALWHRWRRRHGAAGGR